jgi:hypothetical protein
MTLCCPQCHQPFGVTRLGVRFTPLKAELLDRIKAAGDLGVSSDELLDLWSSPVARDTVKAHVWQINLLLEETNFRIVCDGRGAYARWVLTRAKIRG